MIEDNSTTLLSTCFRLLLSFLFSQEDFPGGVNSVLIYVMVQTPFVEACGSFEYHCCGNRSYNNIHVIYVRML